eukprot:3119769-Prymnesium_polylepis.1
MLPHGGVHRGLAQRLGSRAERQARLRPTREYHGPQEIVRKRRKPLGLRLARAVSAALRRRGAMDVFSLSLFATFLTAPQSTTFRLTGTLYPSTGGLLRVGSASRTPTLIV